MFTKVLVVFGLVAVTLSQKQVPIVSESNEVYPDGTFKWHYESGDGSSQQQAGELGKEAGEVVVQGAASWVDEQGGLHLLKYIADKDGYRPQSSDLVLSPPTPAAILRALEWNAAHPEED